MEECEPRAAVAPDLVALVEDGDVAALAAVEGVVVVAVGRVEHVVAALAHEVVLIEPLKVVVEVVVAGAAVDVIVAALAEEPAAGVFAEAVVVGAIAVGHPPLFLAEPAGRSVDAAVVTVLAVDQVVAIIGKHQVPPAAGVDLVALLAARDEAVAATAVAPVGAVVRVANN